MNVDRGYIRLYLYFRLIYSTTMRKVFIADAHLGKPGDFNYQALMKFLDGLKGNTETLFILGDLFEFWIGYEKVPFTQYLPVLEMLLEIRKSGTKIVYFEGNHDFHMGSFFEKNLRAEIQRSPRVLPVNGKKAYLCHGDEIIENDYGYKVLRFLLHNALTGILLPLVPYRLTSFVADRMSCFSSRNHHERNRKWDYEAILRAFAAKKFADGCDVVVTAHFHTPFMDRAETENGEKILISLGDWKTQFSYGEWTESSLVLKKFTP
ncbi:MAG TPA: UDP-2,3-diacylglucosamine diphosphatase [Geobacteraceae bacterium]|nr:UDP-2,3-diacylglucosamine diphosphatase [Geobacteraceae bacterium]